MQFEKTSKRRVSVPQVTKEEGEESKACSSEVERDSVSEESEFGLDSYGAD